jgi:molybdate transport system substrate-binding protein
MLCKTLPNGGNDMIAKLSWPRTVLIAATGMACLCILALNSVATNAAELKVLASVALTSALDELVPKFESSSGNKVVMDYGLAAQLKQRILGGEAADVAILIRPMMDDLLKQEKLSAGSLVDIGGTPVAIAIRAGALKPDISSVEALKRTLISAKSIAYADPAKGGASGVYFAKVIERLGLTDELKAKTTLVPGAQAPELVAKGEVELGVAQASEILAVNGAELLGPLPGDVASVTLFTAGIVAGTKSPDAGKALIQFLTGANVAAILKAKGFDRP